MKKTIIIFYIFIFTICFQSMVLASVSEEKITASDGADLDYFGSSVAISGDYAIVSAHEDDDNGSRSGSAYIFQRSGESWSQQEKLTASDGADGDRFGSSVAISGDYAIICASGDDDNGSASGSAYIFHRSGESWSQQEKITASDGAAADSFGYSVAISGDYAIVGARGDDDNGSASGSSYIFQRSGESWGQQEKITASDGAGGDFFGSSVAISGDYAIVGARGDDDNGSAYGSDYGSAYIFHRSEVSWSQQEKLTASDGAYRDYFGSSVAISGDYAIVGADGDDDNGLLSGSTYIYYGFLLKSTIDENYIFEETQDYSSSDLTIGNASTGIATIESSVVVSNVSTICVGKEAAAVGTVIVSNIGSSLSGDNMTVGQSGSGTVMQTNGTVEIANTLIIAKNTGSIGTYILNGTTAVLNVGEIDIQAGTGTLSLKTGTLKVTTISDSVTNQGVTLNPGHSPGITTVAGDYTHQGAATLHIEMSGPSASGPVQYDQLKASGAVKIEGGKLKIEFLNEYTPEPSTTFDIIDGTISGKFTSFEFPANAQFNLTNLYTTGEITYTGTGIMDSDEDGVADNIDDFDTDPNLIGVDYTPDAGTMGTLTFEDKYPVKAIMISMTW